LDAYRARKVAAERVRNLWGPASVEKGQPSLFGSATHAQADPAARRRRPLRLRPLEARVAVPPTPPVPGAQGRPRGGSRPVRRVVLQEARRQERRRRVGVDWGLRSEEHTSELQSPCNLVCRL